MKSTVIYTDGACSGNPGPGGWAWWIPSTQAFNGGSSSYTTNQRMELWAVYEAIRENPGPLEIRSDSTYVVHCFNKEWHVGWLKRNWRNSNGRPVANRDLWEPLLELVADREVTFVWVKGHSTDKDNAKVDLLAREYSTR